jgi:hypothetical protein
VGRCIGIRSSRARTPAAGSRFTLGAGYAKHVGAYNTFDVRGSYTLTNYKRLEAEFFAPRLFDRRGMLSVIGGWREATEVGFYGTGTANTSVDDRTNYSFRQPYGSAILAVRPTRNFLEIFWALGYKQVEYFLTEMRPDTTTILPEATRKRPSGARTTLTPDDVREIMEHAPRLSDGSYRTAAGRILPGKVLGGFKYAGTRPDDPNDIVPHEHRRELRALRVFGAWTNLTDMKAGNTLDSIITEGGRGVIRHYLQDVGSTFGVGANGPHDWNEGWEHVYDRGPSMHRFYSFGFDLSPWQTAHYEDHPSIGRFEGESFDPETWKPRAPTVAYYEMRDDDAFWAARKVMAFSDDMIRVVVKTGRFTNAAAEKYLGDVLIQRRDKIGRIYLTKINPIVDPKLDASGVLTFANAAVQAEFAKPPASYKATWYTFDNATGDAARISDTESTTERMQAPTELRATPGAFAKVQLSAISTEHPSWAKPVDVYFRRQADGWTLVGFERLPEPARQKQSVPTGAGATTVGKVKVVTAK